jgi:hypothetical protein
LPSFSESQFWPDVDHTLLTQATISLQSKIVDPKET